MSQVEESNYISQDPSEQQSGKNTGTASSYLIFIIHVEKVQVSIFLV